MAILIIGERVTMTLIELKGWPMKLWGRALTWICLTEDGNHMTVLKKGGDSRTILTLEVKQRMPKVEKLWSQLNNIMGINFRSYLPCIVHSHYLTMLLSCVNTDHMLNCFCCYTIDLLFDAMTPFPTLLIFVLFVITCLEDHEGTWDRTDLWSWDSYIFMVHILVWVSISQDVLIEHYYYWTLTDRTITTTSNDPLISKHAAT